MTHHLNQISKLSALGACCSLAVWISVSSADQETSVLVPKPEAGIQAPANQFPVLPPPARPAAASGSEAPKLIPPSESPEFAPTQPRAKSTVKRPFIVPAQPRESVQGQLTTGPESIPMPVPDSAPPAPVVRDLNTRPTPPIVYDTDHDARKMFRTGQIQLVVVTQDPSDGCLYEIPLCIPACCTGEPKIKGGRGLLGRGVVEYCWPCGFKAKVKFRHVLGDVKVEYEGD